MIGRMLGHYRIVEKIGAGGMGEVYRARDEHLGRDVAIKVLPAGTLADESARRRFRSEAEALARLNHPHIATVHDFATQDGVDFLVMEYVAGSSLADRLAGGSVPEKEVLRLGMQVAAALEEAHEHRIVHRDLKPANIRLTAKGDVKVLDFGLAKLLRPVDDINTQSLTQSQAVVGTLPYMAPEQLRGQPVDARTDIYALGCVLYEMAAGRRPFRAESAAELSSSILNKPPAQPSRLNPDLPQELERIILKCLEKDPENRYQSAKELQVDLRRLSVPTAVPVADVPQRRVLPGSARAGLRRAGVAVGAVLAVVAVAVLVGLNVGGLRDRLLGPPATPKIDSLAVLPLENLSRDPEQEYFADGMTEALITELSKISALKVISRTSVMQYKGIKKSMPQIAQELGVDGVIEGSVQREGDQVRITVQLIHGPTDKHLWADSYQRELRGVLALQSEVAREIAREIKIAVTPAEATRLASTRNVNPEAHELYLKGRYQWNKRTKGGLEKALEYFQQAVALDPNYALAQAGLADAYYILGYNRFLPPKEAYPKAKAAALKALALDPNLAEAHASLAGLMVDSDWDWAGAERELKRAIELNPGYATAHQWYALLLTRLARHEEAIAEIEQAQKLDPLSPRISANVGGIYFFARRYDQALDASRRALDSEPNDAQAHTNLGYVYLAKGMHEEAIAEFTKAGSLGDPGARVNLGYAYAVAGRPAEARKILSQLAQESRQAYVDPYGIAVIYAGLGDKEQAFTWLAKAVEERSGSLTWLKVALPFDPLRSDRRYKDLLRRMNFPED